MGDVCWFEATPAGKALGEEYEEWKEEREDEGRA